MVVILHTDKACAYMVFVVRSENVFTHILINSQKSP